MSDAKGQKLKACLALFGRFYEMIQYYCFGIISCPILHMPVEFKKRNG